MSHADQAELSQSDAEQTARHADDCHLDQVLIEDRRARRANCTTQCHHGCGAEELCEQQADHVQQTHRQEHERQTDEYAVVALHDLVDLHPLVRTRQPVVQWALEPAQLFLFAYVIVDEVLVGLDLLGVRQLDPELDPYTSTVQEVLKVADGFRAPAIRIAAAVHLLDDPDVERHEHLFRVVEVAVVQIVDLRCRVPALEHPRDLVLITAHPNDLAHAVLTAEQLLVRLFRQHHDALCRAIGLRIPGAAVLEWRIEHAEEVFGGEPRLGQERLETRCRIAFDDERPLTHGRLPRRDIGFQQCNGIAIGELEGRQLRPLIVPRPRATPAVERHGEQHIVAVLNGVARHQAIHRQRRDADTNTERDGRDHQCGDDRRTTQTLDRQPQVVGEHGRS